jgi:branched-chain amino acid transport system ATP-binding protein
MRQPENKIIAEILQEIKTQGFTTIIVEQNAIAALNLSDRALILDMGEIVFDGTAKEVIENSELRQQYLAI